MSLLNFALQPTNVAIFTDTLATTKSDTDVREPLVFCSKVFPAQHLDLVIAGTGVAQVTQQFAFLSMCESLARNIDELAIEAPTRIRAVWKALGLPEIDVDAPQRLTTVYVFGWSPKAESFIGHAYRSVALFERDDLDECGWGIKPPPPAARDGLEQINLTGGGIEAVLNLIRRQKAECEAEPPDKSVAIGGELLSYELSRDENGTTISSRSWGRFHDYNSDLLKMLARRGVVDRG